MRLIPALLLVATLAGCAPAQAELSPEDTQLAAQGKVDPAIARKARAFGTLERMQAVTVEHEAISTDGLIVDTAPKQGRKALAQLRQQLQGTAYRAYLWHEASGQGPDRVAIIQGDDYAYLALVRTDGINYGLDHDAVVARYREWDEKYGLRLIGAGGDWLEAEVVKSPMDWPAFANEVYAFCPDVVDQGTGDVASLAKEMMAAKAVYLWWD